MNTPTTSTPESSYYNNNTDYSRQSYDNRCSEVIVVIKAPIMWYNQHMNSAIVVAYNNDKNGDDV